MPSIDYIKASDGSGNAAVATVQTSRSSGSSTIIVDTVAGINDKFMGSMGTPHTFVDPITAETITVISEDTCVDFSGHVDGSNLEIDDIAPGQTDLGSEVDDIIIIRPTTQWGDNVAETLEVAHNDDGTNKGGVLQTVRTYTANDTWTKPTGLRFVIVEVVGGGGAGGGADANTGEASSGGGGGGGGYSRKKILAADLGATVAVTIGAAGAGSAGATGGTGGTSSFGAHATATGGVGGGSIPSNASSQGGAGGVGGAGASGDLNIVGQGGSASTTNSTLRGTTGTGGSSVLGGGGAGVANTSTTGNIAGAAGGVYGGGGAGRAQSGAQSAGSGAAGAAGVVIVQEYL